MALPVGNCYLFGRLVSCWSGYLIMMITVSRLVQPKPTTLMGYEKGPARLQLIK